MKKTIVGFLCLLLTVCLALPCFAAGGEYHWYCKRQKDHRQALCDPEMRFIEELDGYYIDHRHTEACADKVVYLTFDAGYENGNVEKVLNALSETRTPGAFFVLSHFAKANPELLRRMADEGHTVCNHTASHKNLSHAGKEAIKAELSALEDACMTAAGIKPAAYFRPPEGSFSREMLESVRDLGYKTVFWSFAYADWDNGKQPSPDAALKLILDNVHNGEVLLLHPTSATNAEILPRLIGELKAQGFRFGTVEELCQ